jgi:hypothetical protein
MPPAAQDSNCRATADYAPISDAQSVLGTVDPSFPFSECDIRYPYE